MSRLDDLEARIAALEAAPAPDNLQPNNQYIGPSGQIFGLFSGGVVLPEETTPGPTRGGAVEWTSDGTPTGTLEEYIQGYNGGTSAHDLAIKAAPQASPNDRAALYLQTQPGAPAGSSVVQVEAGDPSGAVVQPLLDSQGRSSWAQFRNLSIRTQILFAALAAGATAPSGTTTGGFVVTKTAVGQYKITFTQAFADTGYVLLAGASGGYTDYTGRAPGSATVELRSTADVLTDLVWSFLVLGVY